MDLDQLSNLISAIGSLMQGIIWPILIIYLVLHFNEDIQNILKNISEFSFKAGPTGLEVVGKRSIESAAYAGAAMQKNKSLLDSASDGLEMSGIVNTISEATVSKSTSKTSVLWVDDTPSNNTLERRALGALGILFALSTSTNDALDKLKSNRYDLIITDMKRPGDDFAGYTLLREKMKLGNKTPLIIYTGYSTLEQREEAKKAGAFDSTYDPQELFELVLKAKTYLS
jgi:CheY-like chemotaxis protein